MDATQILERASRLTPAEAIRLANVWVQTDERAVERAAWSLPQTVADTITGGDYFDETCAALGVVAVSPSWLRQLGPRDQNPSSVIDNVRTAIYSAVVAASFSGHFTRDHYEVLMSPWSRAVERA